MKRGAPSDIASDAKRARTGSYGFYNLAFQQKISNATDGIAFLETWHSYQDYKGGLGFGDIEFEDLIWQDSSGKSALWLLADAAAKGKPEAFMAVWKKYEDKISLDDLKRKVLDVRLTSAWWWQWMQWMESQHFLSGQTYLQKEYWKSILPAAEKNIICLSVEAAINGNQALFMTVYEKFKDQLTLKDFTERVADVEALKGSPEGVFYYTKSLIYALFEAAANGYFDPILALYNQFGDAFHHDYHHTAKIRYRHGWIADYPYGDVNDYDHSPTPTTRDSEENPGIFVDDPFDLLEKSLEKGDKVFLMFVHHYIAASERWGWNDDSVMKLFEIAQRYDIQMQMTLNRIPHEVKKGQEDELVLPNSTKALLFSFAQLPDEIQVLIKREMSIAHRI